MHVRKCFMKVMNINRYKKNYDNITCSIEVEIKK